MRIRATLMWKIGGVRRGLTRSTARRKLTRLGRLLQAARLAFSVLAVLNVGCDINGEERASLSSGTVIVGVKNKDSLLPRYTQADFLIFSSLTTYSSLPDVESEPRLARSWEASADGRVRTWHLRDDVRWHDGEPLTAHDVKFTFDLMSHPEVGYYWGRFDEVTAVDDLTVRISTTRHDYNSDIVIYPKHLLDHLEPARFWQWDFWTHPVGSGPYRFVRYAPERFIEFEANPDYFAGKPRIERLVIKFIGEAGVTEALAGNVDVVYFLLDERSVPVLKKDERFGIYYGVFGAAIGLYLNHRHPLFSDSRVRRAVALAIDRPAILEAIGLPRDLPLTDVLFSPRQFNRRQLPPPLPYDPEAAQQLLEEAGWVDEDGDGIREKGGIQARFSLNPRGAGRREILIQDYLRRIGLAVEIETGASGEGRARLDAGEFDAGVHVVQPGPESFARYFGENSVVGYRNPRVAEALSQAVKTSDFDALDALYVGIREELARDMPLVLLQPFTRTHAVHRRIKGLNPIMMLRDPLEQMEDLWVEAQ